MDQLSIYLPGILLAYSVFFVAIASSETSNASSRTAGLNPADTGLASVNASRTAGDVISPRRSARVIG